MTTRSITVQYVHARIASIIKKAQDENKIDETGTTEICHNQSAVAKIIEPEEIVLIKHLPGIPKPFWPAPNIWNPTGLLFI